MGELGSEHWLDCFGYKGAGLHLLLQVFFRRLVNSGRAAARGETVVIECNLLHGSLESTLPKSPRQTRAYVAGPAPTRGNR